MKNAQKPDHFSLNSLVNRLKDGRFVIPDFQREFEWEPSDIRELMRSIFLDYYIGSLLLWKGKQENFEALACEPIYGQEEKDREHIVLDGQQRLTAIYYAFAAPDIKAPNRSNRFLFFIRVDRFMEEDYDEAFDYDWRQRGETLLANAEEQFKNHYFPLAIIGEGGWALPNWVQGYEQYWKDRLEDAEVNGDQILREQAAWHARNAESFGSYLKELTEEYQIAYIELDQDLAIDKVCDIFTQINSRGIRLDVFDLMNALLRPKGLKLKHMWQEVEPKLSFVDTKRMNVYVLQVMSILKQAYCSPKYLYYLLPDQQKTIRDRDGSFHKEILIEDTQEFSQLWDHAIATLENAIKLLQHPQEFGVISSDYLPYISIIPAFAALQAQAKSLPANQQLSAQRKIRLWYWASVFTNRYSGSVESTTARDFIDVKQWFHDDALEPPLIGEFRSSFDDLKLQQETKRGSSIYNGIFNLLVLRGARDWMTGNVPQYGALDDHHIVPQSWGRKQNTEIRIDSILNRTPLTSGTNRNVINDRLPNEYLPELIKQNGEGTIRSILESHFISAEAFEILLREPFGPQDFEEFVAERKRTIKTAIEDLLVKDRIALPPQLQKLDARVESIELALRRTIHSTLDGDPQALPSHIYQRATERIQRALRKNPGLDEDHYESLAGILEYCDLRELQGIISSKSLWAKFGSLFPNKHQLEQRFDQLAELRNAIRHSRTVDEITRSEGEASILWFEQILQL